jgi:DNA repair exonuclease SbcCD ATPase subunit
MSPPDLVSDWRREIAEELASNERALENIESELQAAESAHAEALAAWNALQSFVTKALRPQEGLAAQLHSRLVNARDGVTTAERARGAARARKRSLEDSGAALRDAVAQADRIINADRVTPLRRPEFVPKREVPIVSYDNIEGTAS